MKMKRCFSLALALVIAVSSLAISVLAAESESYVEPPVKIQWSSGSFSTTISAGKVKKIGDSFSLEAGDSVNFNASYSPRSASVDFGLIDSDNKFHYINVTSGTINSGIEVEKRGTYTFAIRNNSSNPIDVSGYVG